MVETPSVAHPEPVEGCKISAQGVSWPFDKLRTAPFDKLSQRSLRTLADEEARFRPQSSIVFDCVDGSRPARACQ